MISDTYSDADFTQAAQDPEPPQQAKAKPTEKKPLVTLRVVGGGNLPQAHRQLKKPAFTLSSDEDEAQQPPANQAGKTGTVAKQSDAYSDEDFAEAATL